MPRLTNVMMCFAALANGLPAEMLKHDASTDDGKGLDAKNVQAIAKNKMTVAAKICEEEGCDVVTTCGATGCCAADCWCHCEF